MADYKVEMLKRFPAFEGCDRKELELFAQSCDIVSMRPGEQLITQGGFNHAWWGLLSGQCEVSIDDDVRTVLGPGDFFGEISMEEFGRATATVTALSAGEVLVMSRPQYRAVLGNDRVHGRVLAAAAARLSADRKSALRQ